MKRFWYEGFLGLRYLRASPNRGFVSLIAGIAIFGLSLGVAVLIVRRALHRRASHDDPR
jgi:ABC-type lipoprotein release transport system permease subunit